MAAEKRQKSLLDLFSSGNSNASSSNLNASAPEFKTPGTENRNTGTKPKTKKAPREPPKDTVNSESSNIDKDKDDDNKWLIDIMKNLSSAQSIKDVKNVCCELIGMVVDLSKRIEIHKVKVDQVETGQKELKGDMKDLSQYYDNEIQGLRNDIVMPDEFATRDEVQTIKEKVDDLEGRSRRNNVRIRNIPEGFENGYDVGTTFESIVEGMIKNALDIELEPGSIQRAHRVGKKQLGKPRDIVVYFLRFKDKDLIRKQASIKKPLLGGTKVFFNDDFSPYTLEKRRILGQKMQTMRNEGLRAWLSFDRLRYVKDGFVYEINASPPLFNLSEPQKLFKARAPAAGRNGQTQKNGTPTRTRSSASSSSSSTSQMSTIVESDVSLAAESVFDPASEVEHQAEDSPSILRDRVRNAQDPTLVAGNVINTPAPNLQRPSASTNIRKARSPPTPPVNTNAEKQARSDSP